MTPEHCWGFKILPTKTFYPVHYDVWEQYFDPNYTRKILRTTKDSAAIHLWNKLSIKRRIDKSEPQTAYGAIAEKNCPNVFYASGDYF